MSAAQSAYGEWAGRLEEDASRCAYSVPVDRADAVALASLLRAADEMREALELAEDVLARFPFSTEMWPNGTHPNDGIVKIRAALAEPAGAAPGTSEEG